jgi:hypothetical protein
MKRTALSLALLLAAAGAVRAESVFDRGLAAPPRLELAGRAGAFGAEAIASGLAGGGGGDETTLGTAAWSLLVPGLAQRKLGHPVRARIYYGLETMTWVAAGSFLYAGVVREAAYKDYAVVFAGVSGTDRPDGYWESIGKYQSSDGLGGYNEMIRRDARDLYYPDVEAMSAYYDAHAYTGGDGWQWRTSGDFFRYGKLRDDSRFAYRYALYSVFAAAALRIVSAADAVRLVRTGDSGAEPARARTSLDLAPSPRGPALYLVRSF